LPRPSHRIFTAYIDLPEPVRPAFELILTPLIRSMGPNNGKLLTVLRKFPAGADMLALKVLNILTDPKVAGEERQKMSGPMVALVKSLVAERTLDPRFVVTIMGELDKVRRTGRPSPLWLVRASPADDST
jgi:symplekin